MATKELEQSHLAAPQNVSRRNDGTVKPGSVLNPRGRPSIGAAIIEWMNALQSTPEAELKLIQADATAPPNKRIAAGSLLRALETGYFNATPLAANDTDRLIDRTHGRAVQRIEVTRHDRDPADILADLQRVIDSSPQLARRLAPMLPSIDTTAQVLSSTIEQPLQTVSRPARAPVKRTRRKGADSLDAAM